MFMRCVRIWIALAAASGFGANVFASLTLGDANYLGRVYDGTPSNPANEVVYINNLRVLAINGTATVSGQNYYRTLSTLAGPFPVADVTDAFKVNSPAAATANLVDSFQYILGKYGNNGSLVWYFPNGISGMVTLPSSFTGVNNGGGLSHISAYNKGVIPEPGTIAVWSGLALVSCLAGWRSKR